MDVEGIKTYLKNYAGPRIRIMEVCGSHTAAIEKKRYPRTFVGSDFPDLRAGLSGLRDAVSLH